MKVFKVNGNCYEDSVFNRMLVADAKAEVIDEYKKKIEFEHKWLLGCKVFDTNVDLAFATLECYAEQLKKGNEE